MKFLKYSVKIINVKYQKTLNLKVKFDLGHLKQN